MPMKFDNLALTGWSYEKGDKRIPVEEAGIDKRVLSRNPVKATYVYRDESEWKSRLHQQVRNAVEMAGVNGEDIQAFLGVHNGYDKHPEGASPEGMCVFPNASGFQMDFSLGCASVIMGAQLAGLHFSSPEINNVLLSSVQMTTQYTENYNDGNALFADGIGALVFSRKDSGNMVRYTSIISNPDFRDMFIMDKNGVYQLQNLHKGRDLTEFMIKSYAQQYREGCIAMKTMPKDLDYVAMSCSTYGTTKRVLEAMNYPLEKSGLACLAEIPHMGTNDLIFQLNYGIENGMIKEGSKILVTGTSLGFSIATMAIEWGS